MRTLLNRHLLARPLACLLAAHLLCTAAAAAPAPVEGPQLPPEQVKEITVNEHLGSTLPLDLAFRDEQGRDVQLRQYFTGKKPVVLQLGYYGCPMLCGLVQRGMVESLKEVGLNPGTDYEVVSVSIDPSEKPQLAMEKKQSTLAQFKRPGTDDGWHFLTGREVDIARLADATGFTYRWIGSAGQYAHPAVLVIASPEGKITRYLYGVNFKPQTVRLSLVEASDGKIGTTTDRWIMTCFQYDGKQGRYALAAIGMMRIGGVVTMLVVAVVLIRLIRRDVRLARADAVAGNATTTTTTDQTNGSTGA